MSEDREKFLSRWSRLKQEEAKAPPPAASGPPAVDPQGPPPELPPVEKLTIDSDYTGFFHPKVDEKLRRAALKKLFGDPHFNVMDGLDVYIDDYSKSDPLPAEMLAQLLQGQRIFAWAREDAEKTAAEAAAARAAAQSPAAIEEQPAPPVDTAGQVAAASQKEYSNVEPQVKPGGES